MEDGGLEDRGRFSLAVPERTDLTEPDLWLFWLLLEEDRSPTLALDRTPAPAPAVVVAGPGPVRCCANTPAFRSGGAGSLGGGGGCHVWYFLGPFVTGCVGEVSSNSGKGGKEGRKEGRKEVQVVGVGVGVCVGPVHSVDCSYLGSSARDGGLAYSLVRCLRLHRRRSRCSCCC